MKNTLKKFFFVTALCFTIITQAQDSQTNSQEVVSEQSCKAQLAKRLDFMIDGSFANENVLYKEIAKLKSCGLDEFDINFFGNMDVFSTMLTRISKKKKVEEMTFNDVYTEILQFKEADVYNEIREVTLASEKLGETIGNIRNWATDLIIFQNLGASQEVIDKVYKYLKEHPENDKTYKEILEYLKK